LSIRVPAAFGYLGILAGHAPLIAGLVKGRITLKDASGEIRDFDCEGGGFVEVLNNEVTIVLK
jgi:F0F1-type ATP synthase epsilon subunit